MVEQGAVRRIVYKTYIIGAASINFGFESVFRLDAYRFLVYN
jgi:hypothetical protein